MAGNFLEGLVKGFSKAGAAISADKIKTDYDTDAAIRREKTVLRAKVDAEQEVDAIKRKRAERNLIQAQLLRNQQTIGYVGNPQANALFKDGLGVERPTVTPDDAEVSDEEIPVHDLDDVLVAELAAPNSMSKANLPAAVAPVSGQMGQVLAPGIDPAPKTGGPIQLQPAIGASPAVNLTAPTPTARQPFTETDYQEALQGLSQKTLENSEPETIKRMAESKATLIARKRDNLEKVLANSTSNAGVNSYKAGIGADGKPMSMYEQNRDQFDINMQNSGLPVDIVNPLIFSKGPMAQERATHAINAMSDYYAKEFRGDLADIDKVNQGFGRMLGLSKNAQTGLLTGNINAVMDKFGGDSGVLELKKLGAYLTPRMREAGTGSSSDLDVKMFLDALASIDTPAEINVQTMSNLMQMGQRAQEHMMYDAWLHDQVTLPSPGKAAEMFNQYWKANPAFIEDKQGNLTQNPNKIDFKEWFKGGGAAPQNTAVQEKTTSRMAASREKLNNEAQQPVQSIW